MSLIFGIGGSGGSGSGIDALTGDVTATGPGTATATISNDSVTNAKLANMAQGTIKGRAAGAGTGDPQDLTAAQVSAILGIPAGSDTYVQYNDGGALGADANNTWNKTTKLLTLTKSALATTPTASQLLRNSTAAVVGTQVQVSPSTEWEAQGWKTQSTAASQPVKTRAYAAPSTGVANPFVTWLLQSQINGGSWNDMYSVVSGDSTNLTTPIHTKTGKLIVSLSNNNNVASGTLTHLDLTNPTGNSSHILFRYGSTATHAISSRTGNGLDFRLGDNGSFNFQIGSSLSSLVFNPVQIYVGGIYSNYNGYFGGVLTAGSADTSANSSLNTYGSFSIKGILITSASYTLASTETMVYVDPSNTQVCTGTPTACSTYTNSTDCGTHSGVGCSWFSGNACSAFDNTDQTTCESGHTGCTYVIASCHAFDADQTTCQATSGCTWNTIGCSAFDGTNQSACEDGHTGCTWTAADCHTFDGQSQSSCQTGHTGCSWVGGDCHAFNGTDEATCETGHTGCTWTDADCHTFDGTDMATCETGHTGCTWDGSLCNGTYPEGATCEGTYDEASVCNGTYTQDGTCSGSYNDCSGDYFTGVCSGTYGAMCQGTANCGLLSTSMLCGAESGCAWVSGVNITMPTTASANRNNTSRFYSIVQLTDGGTTTLLPNTSQSFLQYGSSIKLYKKGDRVTLHHHSGTANCTVFLTQTPCEAQTGCTWNPAIVCADYSDQSSCETAGCTWDGDTSTCSGSGTPANCSGTYTVFSGWVPHNVERGRNYVEKTANYTLVGVDDIVNCTTGSFTITLPSAVLFSYKKYTIKNTGSGTITLNTTSSQTIDGLSSGTVTLGAGDSIDVESDAANWIIT